jgi:hypothetical protein
MTDSTGEILFGTLSEMQERDQGRENMIDDHVAVLACMALLLRTLRAGVPFQTAVKATKF